MWAQLPDLALDEARQLPSTKASLAQSLRLSEQTGSGLVRRRSTDSMIVVLARIELALRPLGNPHSDFYLHSLRGDGGSLA
jgi:hypothetical protein